VLHSATICRGLNVRVRERSQKKNAERKILGRIGIEARGQCASKVSKLGVCDSGLSKKGKSSQDRFWGRWLSFGALRNAIGATRLGGGEGIENKKKVGARGSVLEEERWPGHNKQGGLRLGEVKVEGRK